MGRSLFCLGLLIRYGNSLFGGSSSKKIDVASSISLFKKYLQMDDFSIKVRSLQVRPIFPTYLGVRFVSVLTYFNIITYSFVPMAYYFRP